ncbi:carbon monoxide dehydrogenase subunit G [Xanthobacter dioxanivorans]|uniref:Carbon monoxide dehydrogenase subunit G n=1 Tax=Xanthobacter dioxanivorans TaxID=2528964 RepID=A0A974PJS2_9HYPH|nr:carbon monoxide dehydrogenase subunit G [Xanthobacter dioxanivorans]QRG04799.1 carbon monoxide dehydrogenase subunit G [Xanthobacter dioxanivorans]
MDMSGEQRIPAPREAVWRALNDPEILKVCIPGCQELVKTSDTQMTATAVMKVGPVSARFQGAVTLCDLDPPNSYRISGEGQGGVAGFARGEARVRLEADGDDTILHYEVAAQVGGKLAQLGGRLIDATARQMSAAFFKRFAAEVAAAEVVAGEEAPAGAQAAPPAGVAGDGASPAAPGASASAATPAARRASVRPEPPPGLFDQLKGAGPVLVALIAALAWLLFGGPVPGMGASQVSADFTAALHLIIVAAIGYLFGRQSRAGAPRVVVVERER